MSKKKEQGEDAVLPDENASGAPAQKPAATPAVKTAGAAPAAGAASDPAGAGGAEAADPARAALEAEVAELRDRLLRTQADFDNYRKRMLREREESARYANAALLSDLLAVIDDFERAIKSAEESRDFAVFLQGVSMIERRMLEMLESRWGLRRFSSVGEAFDPVRHEAMLRTEAPAAAGADPLAGPVVAEEFQKGYYLHERVLRPAKVRVQVPAESGGPAAADAGTSPAQGPAKSPAQG
jgi:molecular chaperone GrpE